MLTSQRILNEGHDYLLCTEFLETLREMRIRSMKVVFMLSECMLKKITQLETDKPNKNLSRKLVFTNIYIYIYIDLFEFWFGSPFKVKIINKLFSNEQDWRTTFCMQSSQLYCHVYRQQLMFRFTKQRLFHLTRASAMRKHLLSISH